MPTTRLSRRRTTLGALAASAALGLGVTSGTAVAAPAGDRSSPTDRAPGRVVADGLATPFGIAPARSGSLVVAQAAAGEVTRIGRRGVTTTVVGGVPGVAGVASRGRYVWSVLGGPQEDAPDEEQLRIAPGAARGAAPAFGPTSVLRTDLDTGRTVKIADLEDYELAKNPDGQTQLVGGAPVDALSNPFSMTLTPRGLLVADGGANDVLRIDPWSGKISTFYVPPNPTTPECLADGAQANPGTVGCDSVPTGVDFRGGSVYVSTLGSGAPGAGAIYQLSDRTRKVQRTWKGLEAPTGVAVGPGAVFYSQVFGGGSGRIVRVGNAGRVSEASYPTPTGLLHARGRLFASVGSLSPSGSVVVVPREAFGAPR